MKVNIEKLPKSKVKLTIEVPAATMKPYIAEAAAKISQDLKIPGFRPGKAPQDLVEEKIGKTELLQEAARFAVPKTYVEVLVDNRVEAIGEPRIEIKQLAPGNPFIYTAEVAVLPKIELPDYKKIKVKPRKAKVEPKAKEEALKNLQKSRTTYKTVERGAQKGDLVELGFKTYLDKTPVEGGEAKQHRLVLGEDYLLPAPKFDEKLLGMKGKEEREFILRMPDDFHQKHLAGRDLNFEVKMKLVQEPSVPKVDDAFARSLGRFKNLEELKKQIEENLFKQAELKEKGRFEMEIMDKIAAETKVEIPDILVEAEIDKMLGELKTTIETQGGKFDDYLKSVKKTKEELRKELRERGLKRVRVGLILREIAKKENVRASEKEVKTEINKTKQKYQGYDEKVKKEIESEEYKNYIRGLIQNKKVFELLTKSAKG